MKRPEVLDRIVDKVLAYRPKKRTKRKPLRVSTWQITKRGVKIRQRPTDEDGN
jgi:hypothetical protein